MIYFSATNQLIIKTGDLFKTTLERKIALDKTKSDATVIKQLKRELFWANFWKITLGDASAVLTTKLIFKL